MADPPTLLSLPGEIRNRICRYALTSDTPVCLFPVYGKHRQHILTSARPESISHKHFNQLKFVCKQLYAETADLEVKFNSLIFATYDIYYNRTHGERTAEQWFFDFVAPMTVQKMDWLSTVVIATDKKFLSIEVSEVPALPNFSALIAFAKHHPTIKVRYLFKNFGFDGDAGSPICSFIWAGLALLVAFKGVDFDNQALTSTFGRFHPNTNASRTMCDKAAVWSERWNIKGSVRGVKNFAVWPAEEGKMRGLSKPLDPNMMSVAEQNRAAMLDNATFKMLRLWKSYLDTWYREGISGAH